jgi:hypothetical protein
MGRSWAHHHRPRRRFQAVDRQGPLVRSVHKEIEIQVYCAIIASGWAPSVQAIADKYKRRAELNWDGPFPGSSWDGETAKTPRRGWW